MKNYLILKQKMLLPEEKNIFYITDNCLLQTVHCLQSSNPNISELSFVAVVL